MPYLVVMIVDNSPHEIGDVISWRPEGSKSFGLKMLQHPFFRVIHVPDITEAECDALTTPQQGDSLLNPDLKVRAFKLDLDQLEQAGKDTLAATKPPLYVKWNTQTNTPRIVEDLVITAKTVSEIKTTKVVVEPIGGDPGIIG